MDVVIIITLLIFHEDTQNAHICLWFDSPTTGNSCTMGVNMVSINCSTTWFAQMWLFLVLPIRNILFPMFYPLTNLNGLSIQWQISK